MKELFDQVSHQCSQNVTRTYSTSFSHAVKMLSPTIRQPIHAIYGFVRFADEIVDSFHSYDKEELLNEFELDLDKALDRGISLNPILNSFQHVVYDYDIDRDLIDAFLKSMRTDLAKLEYNNEDDYNEYIYGSADVVGLMCLKVFVNGDKEQYEALKPAAMRLGSAFQKVNFLRDFKDDTELLNRSYFHHLSERELAADTKSRIIAEINDDFEDGYFGIKELPIVAKFGVYTAYVYYTKLLKKLSKANASKLQSSRIRISNPIKLMLLARSFVNYKLNLI